MFKRIRFMTGIVLVMSVFLFCSPAMASLVSCIGSPDSSGNCPIEVDDSGYVSYNGAVINKTETATTSDTLTVSESGKTILVNISSGTVTFTLPDAEAGLNYRFVAINGNATSGQGRIYLAPQSGDTFYGCVNSSSASTFAAGDRLYSPETTGDSVTIVGGSGKWYCVDRIGDWADGN